MNVILVTPSNEFEAQVKRAFDGLFEGERRWDPNAARLDPRDAVLRLVPEGSTVVVLGPGLETNHALAMAGHLDLLRPEACVVLVAPPTARLWEQALRAGVRDVLEPDAEDEAVREAIMLAADAAERRATAGVVAVQRGAAGSRARVITILSSKGGSGKTTMATNTAVGLAKLAPERVVLVDLDLQFGDVPTGLQLKPHATMAELTKEMLQIGTTAMKALLEPHPSGLYALCGPDKPAAAEDVSPTLVGQALDLLASEFDYVVVDTAAGLDEYALAAVDRSTDIVLVGATDVPTVKGLHKVVEVLDLLKIPARRHFLLNRSNARVGLGTADIEAAVGLPVMVAVPSTRTIPVSLNQGSPILESNPKSPAARPLADLVTRLAAGDGAAPDPHDVRSLLPRGTRRGRKDPR